MSQRRAEATSPCRTVAFLRGINVGGKNKLPMAALVETLQALGLQNVRTYIQSGNAVFDSNRKPSARLSEDIAASVEERHGFRPGVVLVGVNDLERSIAANPFPEAASEPKTLHLFFFATAPKHPDVESLERLRAPDEEFHLATRVLYLHAPNGMARSKLATGVGRHLGVPVTARNWRTVQAVRDLAIA